MEESEHNVLSMQQSRGLVLELQPPELPNPTISFHREHAEKACSLSKSTLKVRPAAGHSWQ